MNIATIAALGTLFLGLFGLLITTISRCVAKRKVPKGGRSFEVNQELVPKERTSKSIFKKPSAPTNFEQIELSSPSTSFQVKGNWPWELIPLPEQNLSHKREDLGLNPDSSNKKIIKTDTKHYHKNECVYNWVIQRHLLFLALSVVNTATMLFYLGPVEELGHGPVDIFFSLCYSLSMILSLFAKVYQINMW